MHAEKSVLVPEQQTAFLHFHLNSITMQITLIPEKIDKIKSAISALPKLHSPMIRKVGQAIGYIESSLPGVKFEKCHYREMDDMLSSDASLTGWIAVMNNISTARQ